VFSISAAVAAAGLLGAAGLAVFARPRVLLVGDSITAQYGAVAAGQLGRDGYHATVDAYPGLGLLDRGPHLDIVPILQNDLRTTAPDQVAAEFSGDYGLANPPAPGVTLASPAYFEAWARAVQSFEQSVRQRGARLIWVIPPRPLRNPASADRLAAIYGAQSAPRIAVLDTGPVVRADEVNGDLHAPDGAHLSAAGSSLVASMIVRRVERDASWWIRVRAVHGPALLGEVIVAAGLAAFAVTKRLPGA
jgi:hypothetical protein